MGPDFSDLFGRAHPQFYTPVTPSLLGTSGLPYFFRKFLRKPKAPQAPNSPEQERILHPGPFPCGGPVCHRVPVRNLATMQALIGKRVTL